MDLSGQIHLMEDSEWDEEVKNWEEIRRKKGGIGGQRDIGT